LGFNGIFLAQLGLLKTKVWLKAWHY